jgi:hypothetical protein
MALSDADLVQLVERHGSVRAAARAAGIARSSIQERYRKLSARGAVKLPEPEIEYPNLPESELPVEKLIDHACQQFTAANKAREARRWMEIKIKKNEPIGVCFMGDPHIDNAGTNWPLLREHITILETTPGLYAIGGNDITDNWVGRLMRLYADTKMSKKQAWKIVKWLLKDSDVKWLVHILGNHDAWGDGPYIFKANAGVVPVEDWSARFQLVFPNDTRVRIHMSHDFPGTSQWNHLHGAQKQAQWGEQAHIYACAHKHCWAVHEEEHAHRGYTYHLIRARGYKFIDNFADVHGFGSQKRGASITAIIDPHGGGQEPGIRCFPDLEEAAEFLTWKRSRK